MGGQHITTALCFAALVISCSARPDSISRRDHHEENSLPNEIPEDIAKDVNSQKKEQAFNENELQIEGLSDKTSSAIVNSFQSQSNPEQLQQLKDILSLEMKNKDKFAQIYSQMNPEQVKKIRELVLKIGQQTGSPELIQFGQCKLPQFNEKQVQALIGLGEALYDRLNTETTGVQMNRASFSSQGDQSDMFGQMKASIGDQQAFIRRLVNMIEVQLSKAPQIDAAEFAEVKGIMEEIKALSNQVQSRIQKANNLSQLTDMGDQLLKINNLSSKLQHKVSAELLEDRMKEYLNSMSNTNPQQATESTDNYQSTTLNRRSSETNTDDREQELTELQNEEQVSGSNNRGDNLIEPIITQVKEQSVQKSGDETQLENYEEVLKSQTKGNIKKATSIEPELHMVSSVPSVEEHKLKQQSRGKHTLNRRDVNYTYEHGEVNIDNTGNSAGKLVLIFVDNIDDLQNSVHKTDYGYAVEFRNVGKSNSKILRIFVNNPDINVKNVGNSNSEVILVFVNVLDRANYSGVNQVKEQSIQKTSNETRLDNYEEVLNSQNKGNNRKANSMEPEVHMVSTVPKQQEDKFKQQSQGKHPKNHRGLNYRYGQGQVNIDNSGNSNNKLVLIFVDNIDNIQKSVHKTDYGYAVHFRNVGNSNLKIVRIFVNHPTPGGDRDINIKNVGNSNSKVVLVFVSVQDGPQYSGVNQKDKKKDGALTRRIKKIFWNMQQESANKHREDQKTTARSSSQVESENSDRHKQNNQLSKYNQRPKKEPQEFLDNGNSEIDGESASLSVKQSSNTKGIKTITLETGDGEQFSHPITSTGKIVNSKASGDATSGIRVEVEDAKTTGEQHQNNLSAEVNYPSETKATIGDAFEQQITDSHNLAQENQIIAEGTTKGSGETNSVSEGTGNEAPNLNAEGMKDEVAHGAEEIERETSAPGGLTKDEGK